MNHHSSFKYVFFALAGMILFLFLTLFMNRLKLGPLAGSRAPLLDRPIVLLFPVLLLFVIAAAVSVYVHRDACKRGLDPWLWATVAAFVPYFIGLIIYLVVRQSARARCARCGRPLQSDFSNCPYCGQPVSLKCPGCGTAVAADWKVCPRCAAPLNGGGE